MIVLVIDDRAVGNLVASVKSGTEDGTVQVVIHVLHPLSGWGNFCAIESNAVLVHLHLRKVIIKTAGSCLVVSRPEQYGLGVNSGDKQSRNEQ